MLSKGSPTPLCVPPVNGSFNHAWRLIGPAMPGVGWFWQCVKCKTMELGRPPDMAEMEAFAERRPVPPIEQMEPPGV